ncbi:MAG: sugar phosphate nucleotidyltransferase [Candidatus Burarchaeum sp.]|nr:bifunctional sugar-1-phosphate nucleotidylyltransferase/acetyltransferase [Candidatus Burarchaeum sp.]MDO8339932.1 sugar phosphate nucleotidyltransferase [Candidatus Burarchaeum sp.]
MKSIILAAGEGERLRPLTYTKPKCMLPVAGKPILEHVLLAVRDAGFRQAVIVVKYKQDRITSYFGDGSKMGMQLEYVTQGSKYGTAAAFATAEQLVNDDFLGIAGDVICESADIRALVDAHRKHDGLMTVGLKAVEVKEQYGIAEVHDDMITGFAEKPKESKSNLANASIYAFDAKAMAEMAKITPSSRGEYEVTDMIKSGRAHAYELKGYWLDMGVPWQLLDANRYLLEKMCDKREGRVENCTVKGKLIIEKGARVFDSYIQGPVFIGADSSVGPHAYLREGTSIGRGCDISDSSTIKNSILMDGVNAKHLTYIGDSIVGERVNFGAATQVANYRFDEGTIKSLVKGAVVDTGKTKLGVVVGDDTKTGVLSCVMPGKKIGSNCWIGAGVVVENDVPDDTAIFVEQKLKTISRKK